jgi:hypothetical protein
MRPRVLSFVASAVLTLSVQLVSLAAQTTQDTAAGQPEATIDLTTAQGVQLVKGQWRYSDVKIVEVDFRAPGSDGQPTGAPIKTYDYILLLDRLS